MMYRFQTWNEGEGYWEDLDTQDFEASDDAAAVAYARTVYPDARTIRVWNLSAGRSARW